MARIHKTIKKSLNDWDNHDSVLTHLEPDILECEVKWSIRSINTNKASGGDRIPADLFQILKHDVVKVLDSIYQRIWKTSSGPKTGKSQFSFQFQRKTMLKNVQTATQLHSSHKLSKKSSKFSKLGFNSTWTWHGKMDWLQMGKKYVKAIYCHPAYLNSMQSTSCEISPDCQGKYQ